MSRDFSTVVDDSPNETRSSRPPRIHFDVKRFFSLRLPSIVVISLVLGLPLALCGWFLTPVEFSATAQIQYRSTKVGLSGLNLSGSLSGEYEKFVNTEIAKLTGDRVMRDVLNRPSIQQLPSIRQQADPLTFLKNIVTARQLPRSELVNVVCTMGSRKEALEVLSVVTEVYNELAQVDAQKEGSVNVNALNEQIKLSEDKLTNIRKRIETLERELGAMAGGEHPQDSTEAEQYRASYLASETAFKDQEKLVQDLEDRLASLNALQESYRGNPGKAIFDFPVEPMVNSDPRVGALQADLVRLEGEVELMRETHRADHPALQAIERKLVALQRSIEKQSESARGDALKTIEGELTRELETAKRNATDAGSTLASNKARIDSFLETERVRSTKTSEDRAVLERLKDEAAAERVLIETWRTQAQNRQLDERALPRVSVVTPPYAPLTQGITKKLLMAALGLLVAMGLGTSYGVLCELLDGQVRTSHDINRISGLPVLASIPHFGEDTMLAKADPSLLMARYPNSVIADEYRRILARILFPEDNAAEISSLMVVSASSGEGKSSVASNLAVALEHANRSVLLIDLSSQRPAIEETFGLTPGPGLAELLDNMDAREELIRRTAFENLGILGPGMDPRALAGRLASREMMDFMEWADEHFDHIIIDTPPLLLMSDSKLIAPAIDGVLFVVGVGHSSLGMVSRALRDLELLRANTIGIVLNGTRSLRGGYMRQNQKLFYAYTDQGRDGGIPGGTMPDINILDDDLAEPVDAEVVLLPIEKRKH